MTKVWQLDLHQKLIGRNFSVAGLERDRSENSLKLLLSEKTPSLYSTTGNSLRGICCHIPV